MLCMRNANSVTFEAFQQSRFTLIGQLDGLTPAPDPF